MSSNSTTTNTVYVVTGGNRGLGLGLVKALLARPNTTVVATARNAEAVASLKADPDDTHTSNRGANSALHVLQFDFSAAIPPAAIRGAVAAVVDHVDVAVLNAGLATTAFAPALRTTAEDLRAALEVNTIAPLLFFQGLWPLLRKRDASGDADVDASLRPPPPPKLAWITSSVGSIAGMEPFPGGAYGPSRAAQNWLAKALHIENEADGLVAFALHPGWVQTRAGDHVAKEWKVSSGPPVTVEESVEGMLEVIDNATRETVGGKFVTQTGQFLQW